MGMLTNTEAHSLTIIVLECGLVGHMKCLLVIEASLLWLTASWTVWYLGTCHTAEGLSWRESLCLLQDLPPASKCSPVQVPLPARGRASWTQRQELQTSEPGALRVQADLKSLQLGSGRKEGWEGEHVNTKALARRLGSAWRAVP